MNCPVTMTWAGDCVECPPSGRTIVAWMRSTHDGTASDDNSGITKLELLYFYSLPPSNNSLLFLGGWTLTCGSTDWYRGGC
jgi:hypothetical protein